MSRWFAAINTATSVFLPTSLPFPAPLKHSFKVILVAVTTTVQDRKGQVHWAVRNSAILAPAEAPTFSKRASLISSVGHTRPSAVIRIKVKKLRFRYNFLQPEDTASEALDGWLHELRPRRRRTFC